MEVLKENLKLKKDFLNMASKVEQNKSSVGLITEKLFKFYTSKATIRLV